MIGLKLWSNNTNNYLTHAVKLFEEGWYDYIELYYVPNTLNTVDIWKATNIPFTIHAPHLSHGVNLSKSEHREVNFSIFSELKIFIEKLNAKYVIVHSGTGGNIGEVIYQLKKINIPNLMLENKPYFSLLGKDQRCCGSTILELKTLITELSCNFCLDIGHAICTYNAIKNELGHLQTPYQFIRELNELTPLCYHITDNFIDSTTDRHLHIGDGNYDFKEIFKIIDNNKDISIETNKIFQDSLNDFKDDILKLKKFY